MKLNPEFFRQLTLEFTRARLFGIPLVLGVVFTFCYFLDDYRFGEISANHGIGLFLLTVGFWGGRQAASSVLDELRERTWDTQRLSALGPWSMMWGKWFGSTLVTWYGGFFCLAVYALAYSHGFGLIWICSYAVLCGLVVQGLSFMLALIALQKGLVGSNSLVALVILLGFWLLLMFVGLKPELTGSEGMQGSVHWYGMPIGLNGFCLLNLVLGVFWISVGNYRLMVNELCIRTLPWAWLAFLLFLITYLGGFIDAAADNVFIFLSLAFCTSLLLTYLILLIERNEPMRMKRLATYAAQQNFKRIAEELPLWCVSLALAFPFALLLSLVSVPLDLDKSDVHFYALAILLLLLRDIGIYLYYSYGKNPQRALILFFLTLVLVYGVVPGIFAKAGQDWLVTLVLPLWSGHELIATFLAAVQVVLMAGLLYRRWYERVYRPVEV